MYQRATPVVYERVMSTFPARCGFSTGRTPRIPEENFSGRAEDSSHAPASSDTRILLVGMLERLGVRDVVGYCRRLWRRAGRQVQALEDLDRQIG